MSDSTDSGGQPRAMIHQRIIDAAADRPDASLDALADDVPGASPGLVERVLDEYGDPAADGDAGGSGDAASGATGTDAGDQDGEAAARYPEPAALSPKQRETLRAIRERPTATQRELAADLGVTAATISQRVNGIPGFEWADRAAFADGVLGDATGEPGERGEPADAEDAGERPEAVAGAADVGDTAGGDTADGDTAGDGDARATAAEGAAEAASDGGTVQDDVGDRLAHIQDRLTELEAEVESLDAAATGEPERGPGFEVSDPELAAKVVRACVADDDIEEREEVRIIRSLLG